MVELRTEPRHYRPGCQATGFAVSFRPPMRGTTDQSRETLLQDFITWCGKHITGDEKGEAQIFLDHLFRAFG